ncbi:sacsin N-terminal ATP-binding-like domain-containing protein [Cellulomonas marina]|uniref:sacsin N-terminal ATP-binding-like domain-containing protein n=1 Tax=Cellulomonas marina TaxID=988821 RepID=UPI0011137CCA|nr:DEAD/DEAH box helicase family protein [Cellulomonas marina]
MREQTEACLAVYAQDRKRVEEDANNERRIAEGGYRFRQLDELLQNAVDAARVGGSRIEIRLTSDTLYVANDGEPFTRKGVEALMASDLSAKDDDRIGRFGIGFKSVLAITTEPRVYSRSVSFAFEQGWAERTIREAGFDAPRYPTMRLARVVDAGLAAREDARLAELMEWASTVIVLPGLTADRRAALTKDLSGFRAEFLLFSPHISEVRLVVEERDVDNRISAERHHDGSVALTVRGSGGSASGDVSRWQVFSREVHPPKAVLAAAGRMADRESLRIVWAVPERSRTSVGSFWAYFPTHAGTTLAGIVSAPFQLSDDRTDLLRGAFNLHLLREELPQLVASALASLAIPGDEAALLDLLPARGREDRSWADGVINEPIFAALRQVACVPDVRGRLRRPETLSIAPEGVDLAWGQEWSRIPTAPLDEWVHPAALSSPERRNKVRRLVESIGGRAFSGKEWLECVVREGDVPSAAAAIRLAAGIVRGTPEGRAAAEGLAKSVLEARIVPLEDGSLVRPVKGRIFIRTSPEDASGAFVDPKLVDLPGVVEALGDLGVTVLDKKAELEAALIAAAGAGRADAWQKVWQLAQHVPEDVAAEAFEAHAPGGVLRFVRVRSAAGAWVGLGDVFLGGSVIPSHARRDAGHLVDPRFHEGHVALLRRLGAVSEPQWRPASDSHWLTAYRDTMRDKFLDVSNVAISSDQVEVEERPVLWPLGFLEKLSPEGRLELTRLVLDKGAMQPWRVRSRRAGPKPLSFLAPEEWLIRKHGLLDSSLGPMRPCDCIAAAGGLPGEYFPVADISTDLGKRLGVKTSTEQFTSQQWAALKQLADSWGDDRRRYEFYTYLPGIEPTTTLVVRVGRRLEAVQSKHIGVTDTEAVYESLVEAAVPAMILGTEDAAHFRTELGLPDGRDLLKEEVVATAVGEEVYLIDEFPPLKSNPALKAEDLGIRLQRCSRIVRLVATPQGQVERPLENRREPGRVLVTGTAPEKVLAQVSDALSLGMSAADIRAVLAKMEQMRATHLRQEVRRAARADALSGIVAAVGPQALRSQVPKQALDLLERGGAISDTELARLALSVHGVGILKTLRASLEERGLEPPREFGGRQNERRWVADMGFPAEWAGFPSRRSPARELIDGPVELSPLHPYQLTVTERIRALLAGIGRQRGVVSLPTGAGKTRVTVQALVEEVAAGRLTGPIVWIAQSEELCEQAAESWTYVWRALGPGELVLSRLWGSNEVEEEPVGTQVVVATDAKLDSIIGSRSETYAWLREPSVVVVDEAHTSVSQRYTAIFDWLGLGARSGTTRPLLGLTATPFRGNSDEETSRLVRRYDSNLLDQGVLGDDPYRTLREMKVLAEVEKRRLDGAVVHFSDAELAEIDKMQRFPSSRETQLGEDVERNERIVRSICDLPEDWPVLLFAPSVENARSLAALLSHRGVTAQSISAATEGAARRHYIDEFRQGRIRVLTNYNVLTQGFDAPAVKAVYVCRPTFSPNVYQQMVGRGLRGELNGGSERVLIVDVEDNLNVHGERLAFRAFEKLWTS